MSNNEEKLTLRKEISDKLKSSLIAALDIPYEPDDISGDTALIGAGLGLDSLDVLEIVLCVENNFGIKMPEGDTATLRSFNTLIDFIIESQGKAEKASVSPAENQNPDAELQNAYNALRHTVVLSQQQNIRLLTMPEAEGIDRLDENLAANILKLRYGGIIDTFLAREDGSVAAEALVANIDDKVITLFETTDNSAIDTLAEKINGCQDITLTHSVFCVDGPLSWKVAKAIFGADILNLPYLATEKYEFESQPAYLFRSGRTGEFGYAFIVPNSVANNLKAKLSEEVKSLGGCECTQEAINLAKLESGFFNVFEEGAKANNPIELGLQWMSDFSKDNFCGVKAISEARNANTRKLVAIRGVGVKLDAQLFNGTENVGSVISAKYSYGISDNIGLALVDSAFAHSSIELSTFADTQADVLIISRPAILSDSLTKGME